MWSFLSSMRNIVETKVTCGQTVKRILYMANSVMYVVLDMPFENSILLGFRYAQEP